MLKRIFKNPILLSTVVSQLATLLLASLFTRIFSPEDFGVFYSYSAVFSMLLVFSRLNNDTQMLKAKDLVQLELIQEQGIQHLRNFLILVGLALTLMSFAGVLSLYWFALIPGLLSYTLYWQLYHWSLYHKRLKQAASLRLQDTFWSNGLRFTRYLGLAGAAPLILAQSLAPFAIVWAWPNKKVLKAFFRFNKFWIAPETNNWQLSIGQLANTGLFQLPLFVLSIAYDNAFIGFLGLSFRMVRMPIAVLGIAVADQFKSQYSDLLRQQLHSQANSYLFQTLKFLVVVCTLVAAGLFLFSPWVFSWYFGEDWALAGKYAQILSIPFALALISSPLSFIFYLANRSKQYMTIQLFLLGLIALWVATPLLGDHWELNQNLMVYGLAAVYTLNYLLIIIFALKTNRQLIAAG